MLYRTLKERVEAVESIISAEEFNCRDRLLKLRELLKSLGSLDLAKGLSRIQYLKVRFVCLYHCNVWLKSHKSVLPKNFLG